MAQGLENLATQKREDEGQSEERNMRRDSHGFSGSLLTRSFQLHLNLPNTVQNLFAIDQHDQHQ